MKWIAAGLGLLGGISTLLLLFMMVSLCSCAPRAQIPPPALVTFARSLDGYAAFFLVAAGLLSLITSVALLTRRGPGLVRVQGIIGATITLSLALIWLGQWRYNDSPQTVSMTISMGAVPGLLVLASALVARRALRPDLPHSDAIPSSSSIVS